LSVTATGAVATSGERSRGQEESIPWTYWDIGKAILAVIALSIVTTVLAVIAADALLDPGQGVEDNAAALSIIITASIEAQEIFLFGAALWFGTRTYHLGLGALGLRKPDRSAGWFTIGVTLAALAAIYGYTAALSLLGIDQGEANPEEVWRNAGPLIVVTIGTVLMAPIAEELFFRGFIYGGTERRWGWWRAAVASGLLFALAHLSPIVIPPFLVVGILFAWLYRKTGSTVPSIAAHALVNATAVVVGIASS
jgi:membrane protease YdiL (CAAX protease family)